ncbi:MAG: hypothetical protein ACKVRN_16680 [Pyrinomonadaceae bacterium]
MGEPFRISSDVAVYNAVDTSAGLARHPRLSSLIFRQSGGIAAEKFYVRQLADR